MQCQTPNNLVFLKDRLLFTPQGCTFSLGRQKEVDVWVELIQEMKTFIDFLTYFYVGGIV